MEQKGKFFFLAIILALSFQVQSSQVNLEKDPLEAQAREIHKRIITIDSHCDTASNLGREGWDIAERHEPGQRNSGQVDLPRMIEGGLDAEFFAVFVGQGETSEEGYAGAKQRAIASLEAIHKMCEDYSHLIGLATSPDDAYRLKKAGKLIAFIGMENGYPIGKDLSLLEEYHKKGISYLTLCHSQDNQICDSSTDRRNPEDRGLSDFGRTVVEASNRLGIMIDVSHISDKSFSDVLRATKAPVIASHSSCRALCPSPRNLSDEMIKALAANGGVIQICFLSSYVKTPKPNPERDKALKELEEKYGSRREIKDEALREKVYEEYRAISEKYPEDKALLKDVVDHIDHVVDIVGIDYVGIGTDFDGGGGVLGCNDVSQMFEITVELLRRGYSEDKIQKIWGGNILRVFSKVIEISGSQKESPVK